MLGIDKSESYVWFSLGFNNSDFCAILNWLEWTISIELISPKKKKL